MTLFWSRDKVSYNSESMALLSGNNVYRTTVPAQDGSDNLFYKGGAGEFYWYIRLASDVEEEAFLFSASNPNDEIYFLPLGSEETTDTTFVPSTDEPTNLNPIGEALGNLLSPFLPEDVTKDPVFQAILTVGFGVVIAGIIVASRADRILAKVLGVIYRKK